MEKDQKVASEDPKVDLFEDDDEFEEFEINEGISLPFGCSFLLLYWDYASLVCAI